MISILMIVTLVLMLWKGYDGFRHGFVKELVGFIGVVILAVQLLLIVITVESVRHQDLISAIVAVAIIVVFALAHKAIRLISIPVRVASSLPLIRVLNKLAGILVGFTEAFSMLWVVFYYIDCFGTEGMKSWMTGQIDGNQYLTWLYGHNYLVEIILYIMKNISGWIAGLINGL
ncbi:MAG: CvpA family protein [Lachnospiraceae bacterium]|nr:CvpA family protein [Lachnospiraceae bacterium]